MTAPVDWSNAAAPSLADIEALAAAAWEALPLTFRQMSGDLVIRIEEFAFYDVLAEFEIKDPYDLMGLYHGISLRNKSVSDSGREPDMVVLYRRAILDYWADSAEPLGHIVTHVLVHEIGHHFGLSDDDMAAIENQALA